MCTNTSLQLAVNESPLNTSGLEIFVPRETYYIILEDYDDSGKQVHLPLLQKHSDMYSHLMTKLNDFVEYPKKQSTTSSSPLKLKQKEVNKLKEVSKSKSRLRSATSRKEGTTYTTTLPPINQKN